MYVVSDKIYEEMIKSGIKMDKNDCFEIDAETSETLVNSQKTKNSPQLSSVDLEISTTEYVYMLIGGLILFCMSTYFFYNGQWFTIYPIGLYNLHGHVSCLNPALINTTMIPELEVYEYNYFASDKLLHSESLPFSNFSFNLDIKSSHFDDFGQIYFVFKNVCQNNDVFRVGNTRIHQFVFLI
uniref:Uncharacterized protein n=1 Tax=Panagrolaimus sp. JU765 TaxID=591449 RepID=A0AC34RSC8_9BILA